MSYISKLSVSEANYILTAFHRLEDTTLFDKTELCLHSLKQNFFSKHNDFIRSRDEGLIEPFGLVKRLQEDIVDIATDERFQKNVMLEFQNILKSMSFYEAILWLPTLLIDLHKKDECCEYLTLALKMKLVAFYKARYINSEDPATVMKSMIEFMDNIFLYKCGNSHELFLSCICVFNDFFHYQPDDPMYPVLPKVLEVARALRFNMFNVNFEKLYFDWNDYCQHAILYNPRRFLILTAHGYQDSEIPDTLTLIRYRQFIQICDTRNFFGYRGTRYEEESLRHEQLRAFQVLFLYIRALYNANASGEDRKFYANVLHILWESIPDPYLSCKKFMSSFKKAKDYPTFWKVWKWYTIIVLKDTKNKNAPRSLKHLARCSVRHTLTECVQLPSGVEVLELPRTLKRYLCLE